MGCTSSWVYYPVAAVLKSSLFLGMKWEKYIYTICHILHVLHHVLTHSIYSMDCPSLFTLVAFVEHLASIACVASQVYTQRKYHFMEDIYILCSEQLLLLLWLPSVTDSVCILVVSRCYYMSSLHLPTCGIC